MNRIRVLGVLAIAVSAGFAHTVRIDFDHGAHFSSYKTYRWVDSPDSQSSQGVFPNQLMEQRITGFVEEALAARGLKRVTTGGDLLVSCRLIVREQPQYVTYSDGGPVWGWGWGGGYSTTTIQYLYEGTLVIDIVDANRGKLVFEGTSTQSVSSRAEKNTEKLAKAVNKVMAKYPPQP